MNLKEMLKAALARMKAISKELEAEADADKAKTLTDEFETLEKEAEGLRKRIEVLKKAKAITPLADDDDDDDKTKELDTEPVDDMEAIEKAADGKPSNICKFFATPRDIAVQAIAEVNAFQKALAGEELYRGISEREFEKCLNPTTVQKWRGKPSKYVRVPDLMKAILLGTNAGAALGCMSKATSVMGTGGSYTTGGLAALVNRQFLAEVMSEQYAQQLVLDRVRVIPCASGTLKGIVRTQSGDSKTDPTATWGFTVEWLEEAQTVSAKTMATEAWTINCHEVGARMIYSNRSVTRSEIDLEGWLREALDTRLRYGIAEAIISGNGTTAPKGLTITTGIREVARQTTNQVVYTDLVNLKYEIPRKDRLNGGFTIADDVEQYLSLATISATDERTLFTIDTSNGIRPRLAGRDYVVGDEMPFLGSDGDVIFGDWKNYLMPMEDDIVVRMDDRELWSSNQSQIMVLASVGGEAIVPTYFSQLVAPSAS